MKRLPCGLVAIIGLVACEGVYSDPHADHSQISQDAPAQDAPAIDGQIVFTTSTKYRGEVLGGVEGADAICATHASEAGLSGEFKAWLSQLGSSAADRLTHSIKPYVLFNGTVIADSWDDLLRFDLQHAIDLDEHGASPELVGNWSDAVWADTRFDGQEIPWTEGGTPTSNPRLDCTLWTADGGVGMIGSWNATGPAWTSTGTGIVCSETARLYCFQQ